MLPQVVAGWLRATRGYHIGLQLAPVQLSALRADIERITTGR